MTTTSNVATSVSKPKQQQAPKVITKAEVSKHNTLNDAWVMHNGYVYDITTFIQDEKHPGGKEVFEDCLGQDVHEVMVDTDHSPFAYNLIKEFMIGTVEGEKQSEMFPVPPKQMRGYEMSEVRDIVDFDKPVMNQIAISGDRYWPWMVNRPVCSDLKIFGGNVVAKFIEDNLTRWPWWYIWVVFPPAVIYHLYMALTLPESEGGAGVLNTSVSFVFGVFAWTLMEYLLHRFVFHMESHGNIGNLIHFFAHGVHHLQPSDSSRLTFPPPLSVAIGVIFHHFFQTVVPTALMSWWAVWAGLTVGYVVYDTAHYFFHHSDFDNKLFRYCKSAHLGHHYKNEDMNFGVTSPMWDLVFGTYDPYNTSSDTTKNQ